MLHVNEVPSVVPSVGAHIGATFRLADTAGAP